MRGMNFTTHTRVFCANELREICDVRTRWSSPKKLRVAVKIPKWATPKTPNYLLEAHCHCLFADGPNNMCWNMRAIFLIFSGTCRMFWGLALCALLYTYTSWTKSTQKEVPCEFHFSVAHNKKLFLPCHTVLFHRKSPESVDYKFLICCTLMQN